LPDLRNIKIAVSGKSGCGNTTVSRLAAEKLGLTFINFTFRSLAEEKNITLKEVLEQAALDDWWDREVDSRQVYLARKARGCVLGSRLAIWMLTEADLKVYLTAAPETRVSRIVKREGGSVEEIAAFTEERDKQDRERYKRIYNIDNDDYAFADLVIDTDTMSPEEIADAIIKAAEERIQKKHS
jgi:cytidylate kinase